MMLYPAKNCYHITGTGCFHQCYFPVPNSVAGSNCQLIHAKKEHQKSEATVPFKLILNLQKRWTEKIERKDQIETVRLLYLNIKDKCSLKNVYKYMSNLDGDKPCMHLI